MRHNLKISPLYFDAVDNDIKNFEIRKDDRGFEIGDTVVLSEFANGEYTGRIITKSICYILRNCPEYGLQDGYCILGF